MFVKKLSEMSLRDLEIEKNNLNGLFKEVEKEVIILKILVKIVNSNVEEFMVIMKVEM